MKNRINHLLNFFILHFPARKTLLLVCMLSVPFLAIANQSFTVTGTVTDEDNEPLIGVNITVEGTSGSSIKGTATDLKGEYRLEGISRDAVLIFSYVGYAEQRIAVGGQSVINVTLRSNSKELDEVVVVGYGSVKKKDLTGAVSIVDTDVLKNKSVTTLADALQGAATGVYVRGGSQPGSESAIQIRGVSSLTNNNPLYVIDGMLTSANRDLNVADIESIQILKDASAAAIYGSRAANGVIIITTKKGTEGPMKVSASLRKGIQTTPRYDLADRNEFIRLNDMAYANAGLPAQDHRPDINTDWQDAAFRTGQVDDYNVSLSGGGKFSNYMVSGNYFKNKGTLIGTSFDRVSVRVNTEARKGILKFGENLAISNATSTELPTLNPYWEVLRMLPTIPVYDEENPGGYGYGDGSRAKTFGSNPVAMTDLQNRSNENFRLRGNAFLEVDLFKIFTYKVNFGYETSFSNHRYLRKEGTWTYNQPANDPSEIYEIRAQYENILVENTLNFNFDIGKHHLDGVGGITYQKEQNRQIGAQKKTILRTSSGEYFREIDAGSSDPQSYGNGWNTVMISYLGRVNYNYDGKYLLTGTIRSDGSSRFKEGKRWGVFPSVSGAWRISSENFFSVDWVDDLKIRANYGTLGSVNIGAYDYFAVINQNTPAIFNNQIFPGSTQVKLINENLKWETLVQQNYGIDAVLFNNRLSVGMEYYIADSKDILYGMPIASSTGNDGGNPVVNAASLKNTGFELSLLWRDKIGKVNYKVGLNTTTLKNKVKGLGYGEEEVITETTISKVGKPLGMWYLIKTDGLFQNDAEVLNHTNAEGKVIQPDAKPGDIRFIDFNGDGQITNADRQEVGSPWAKVEFGLNMGVEWNNFDLSMMWFVSLGGKLFNSPRHLVDRFDDNSNYRSGIQPWEKEGDTGFPRVVYTSTQNSLLGTDRWLENGSFARLKDISIGYQLPKPLISKIHFEQVRFYLSAQNLITITKYKGLDPEFNGGLYERGRDYGRFPNVRSAAIGLNVVF